MVIRLKVYQKIRGKYKLNTVNLYYKSVITYNYIDYEIELW